MTPTERAAAITAIERATTDDLVETASQIVLGSLSAKPGLLDMIDAEIDMRAGI